MSGIAGIFRRDGGPVAGGFLGRMLQTMHYRGPDGSRMWIEGSLGLGLLMLNTTPESSVERNPEVDVTGRYVLTADARLDNREELIDTLGFGAKSVAEISDGEIIVRAYAKWGDRSPAELVGDFAYCVWDRARRELFCCRDPFGVRPFYYHSSHHVFSFASEIRPLLGLEWVPRKLNELAVADYLIGMPDDQTLSFYRDLLRLPPGHTLLVKCKGERMRRYWSLDPSIELRMDSDMEYAEAFRDLFVESVRCRLRSSHPVATTLSGGLDSSSVTCVARDLPAGLSNTPLTTLSLIYDHVKECDEREYIEAVLAQGSVTPVYLEADSAVPLPYFDLDGPYLHDDPLDAPTSFAISARNRLHESGIRVVLDGFDGDNTVSHGYAYLAELAHRGRFITLVREALAVSSRESRSCMDLLWRKAIRPLTPAIVRKTWRRLTGYGDRPWAKDALISPDFAERMGLAERYRHFNGFYLKPVHNAREDHCRSLTWGGLTQTLESMNKIAARGGIEPRHPFFDRRLAEFCTALPHSQKICKGWTRMVLRRGMDGILPAEIQWRAGKIDFRPSFNYAILGMNRDRLEGLLQDSLRAIERYVDPAAVNRSYAEYISNPLKRDPSFLRFALSLGLWLSRADLQP
ncbi:MAG: lasso peptide isopeptide bond-forming cyclase [Desulfomonilaceae bacterium]|nr:lasso peptide isopeptide bond-forming cyclase [Desulfomonilaceae bacterium]